MEPLVTTEWLAGALGQPGVVVFDATKYLPNESFDRRIADQVTGCKTSKSASARANT